MLTASSKNIPWGCCTNYIQGLPNDVKVLYEEYTQFFEDNHWPLLLIQAYPDLWVSWGTGKKWQVLIESTDMTHSRRIREKPGRLQLMTEGLYGYWKFPTKVSSYSQPGRPLVTYSTAEPRWSSLETKCAQDTRRAQPRTLRLHKTLYMNELDAAIKVTKNNFTGLDNIWLSRLSTWSSCSHMALWDTQWMHVLKIPTIWRKVKVIALLKPDKARVSPKSYRTISLLCPIYNLFGPLNLNRLTLSIDAKLISGQAGFRNGKSTHEPNTVYCKWISERWNHRFCICWTLCRIWHCQLQDLKKLFAMTGDSFCQEHVVKQTILCGPQ